MKPASYTQIAPVYDTLMQEVDYRGWVFYITEILSKNGISPPSRILDLACGTGTATVLLAQAGFQVMGIDLSQEMLALARAKTGSSRIDWQRGDMRHFEINQPVDAVICLFDSINHLIREAELENCFTCVHRALRLGGVFLFDMNTILALSQTWGNSTRVRQDGEVHSIWRSTYQPCDRTARMELTVFVPNGNGGYRKIREIHLERGYEISEIEECLKNSGFQKIQVFKHGNYEPPDSDTGRVMIIAKK